LGYVSKSLFVLDIKLNHRCTFDRASIGRPGDQTEYKGRKVQR